MTKLVSQTSIVEWRGWKLKVPFPILSYDLARKDEERFVKASEFFISLSDLQEIITAHVGYNFLIYSPVLKQNLIIFIPEEIAQEEYEKIKRKISYMNYRAAFGDIKLFRLKKERLEKLVYPHSHHKPHNIVEVLPPELQNFQEK